MTMSRKVIRIIVFITGCVALIVASNVFSQFYYTNTVKAWPFNLGYNIFGTQRDKFHLELSECHNDSKSIVVDSENAYFEVLNTKPINVDRIVIKTQDPETLKSMIRFEVKTLNDAYCDFSSTLVCSVDEVYSELIMQECSGLRVTILAQPGAQLPMTDLVVYENYIVSSCSVMSFVLSIILVVMFYVLYYGETSSISAVKVVRKKYMNIPAGRRIHFCLLLATGLTCFIVFSKLCQDGKLFMYNDIGADTKDTYIGYYINAVNKLRSGTVSPWAGNVGFGVAWNQAVYLDANSVITILLGLVFGSNSVPYCVMISFTAVAILTAEVGYRYLKLFSNKTIVVAIAAYVLAFNSFSVVWGQHYFFQSYVLYMIIVLYGIEKFLRQDEHKCSPLVVSGVGIVFAVSAYCSYMVLLAAAVYSLVRIFILNEKLSLGRFFKKMFLLLVNVLLGLLGGFSLAVFSISSLMGTSRLSSSADSKITTFLNYLTQWYLPDEFIQRIKTLISPNLSGIGSNYSGTSYCFDYYNSTQLFFGILFIIIVFQYVFTLFRTKRSTRNKVIGFVAFSLVVLSVTNVGVTYIMYGMSEISQRYLFTIIPFLAILFVKVVENIVYEKIFSMAGFVLGLILSVICLMQPFVLFGTESIEESVQLLVVIDFILLTAGAIILILISEKRISESVAVYFLAVMSFLNCTSETLLSIDRSGNVSIAQWEQSITQSESTQKALEYIESIDDSYYRVEKTYIDFTLVNDSVYEDYKSVTMYDSNMKSGTDIYCNYYLDRDNSQYPRWLFPIYSQSTNDIIQYSQLGVKYILSKDNGQYSFPQDKDLYELIATIDGINIYKNKAVTSFTTFFTQAVTEEEFLSLSRADRIALMSNTLVVDNAKADILSEFVSSADELLKEYNQTNINSFISQGDIPISEAVYYDQPYHLFLQEGWGDSVKGTPYLELSLTPSLSGTLRIFFDTGDGYDYQNNLSIKCQEGVNYTLRNVIPRDTTSVYCQFEEMPCNLISINIFDSMENIIPTDNAMAIKDERNDALLKGTISCEEDGLLFIPIPISENWSVTVDGTNADIFTANSGFMGIRLDKGKHIVEISYSVDYSLSTICLVACIVLTMLFYYYPSMGKILKR